jgi:hypothetical protein
LGLLLLQARGARARDLWTSPGESGPDETALTFASALKLTGLGSAPSSDPAYAAEGYSATGLLRLRLEPGYQAGSWKLDAAYDNQLYDRSASALSAAYALPTTSPIPFRLRQISVAETSGNLLELQQLDRAFVSHKSESLELTAGRQAIGWGRGTMFSAVDIFAPFTPLQIDQEWRPGVDALSGDYKLTDNSSIQIVAAGAQTWNQSALGGRLRGYLGPVDAELLVAKRAQDTMVGATSSAALKDAEVHGEFAVFQTPGDTPSGGIGGDHSLIPKAVFGASDNFPWGSGLKATLEYHYSGFGAAGDSALSPLLLNRAFQARLVQGATQIVGDQVLGFSAAYTFNQRWSAALTFLQSLMDASGVLAPSATWEFSERASLLGSVYAAYGTPSSGGILRSQFGAVPPTLILQLRIYD